MKLEKTLKSAVRPKAGGIEHETRSFNPDIQPNNWSLLPQYSMYMFSLSDAQLTHRELIRARSLLFGEWMLTGWGASSTGSKGPPSTGRFLKGSSPLSSTANSFTLF